MPIIRLCFPFQFVGMGGLVVARAALAHLPPQDTPLFLIISLCDDDSHYSGTAVRGRTAVPQARTTGMLAADSDALDHTHTAQRLSRRPSSMRPRSGYHIRGDADTRTLLCLSYGPNHEEVAGHTSCLWSFLQPVFMTAECQVLVSE